MMRGSSLGCLAFLLVATAGSSGCDRNRDSGAVTLASAIEAAGGSGGAPVCLGIGKECSGSPPCCPGLTCIGTCVQNPSDRNLKRDFAEVDRKAVLEGVASLPISTWTYKAEPDRPRHIGPMAQDFKQTFNVGGSDKTIFQVDADGVTFAAIQALDAEIKRLTRENAELRQQIDAVRVDLGKRRTRR